MLRPWIQASCGIVFVAATACDTGSFVEPDVSTDERSAKLAHALAAVSQAKPPFLLTAGAGMVTEHGDEPPRAGRPRLVRRGNDLGLDLSAVAIGETHRRTLEALVLPMPEEYRAGGELPSLDDSTFEEAVRRELVALYRTVPGVNHAGHLDDDRDPWWDSARLAMATCQEAGPTGVLAKFGDEVPCTSFLRQAASGRALGVLEATALTKYTGAPFRDVNSLLRGHSLRGLDGAVGGASAEAIVSAFVLAMISGANKLDKLPGRTYRGISLKASCGLAATSAPLDPGPLPTSIPEAVDRFCRYAAAAPLQRDCGFTSTSRDVQVSLGRYTLAMPKDGTMDHHLRPDLIRVLYTVDGRSGVDMVPFSEALGEREVLYPPATPFAIVASSARIALFTKNETPPLARYGAIAPDVDDYELVPCGALAKEDEDRISHFRVSAVEVDH